MNKAQHIYTIDIFEPLSKFRSYHQPFANPQVPIPLQMEYLHMLVEQMIAHFEIEHVAVETFVGHYVELMTNPNLSPNFKYHPLKFLKQMDNDGYKHYAFCLFGFAMDMLKLLQVHRLYNSHGILLASFQHIEHDTLYLIVRPEVSHVLCY